MQGWLEPVAARRPGAATAPPRGPRARLDEAADRIYRLDRPRWDGTWQLVFVDAARRRAPPATGCAPTSRFVGYAELADHVWVSPFARRRARPRCWSGPGRADGPPGPPTSTRRPPRPGTSPRCGTAYARWPRVAERAGRRRDRARRRRRPGRAAFAARFHLVHEWRKFLFADPGLPGRAAAAGLARPRRGRPVRRARRRRLEPGADRFVARCLDGGPAAGSGRLSP